MSDTTRIVFPDQLRSHPKTPVIMFYAKDPKSNEVASITLPCPPAISFADAAEFSTLDLGLIGSGGEMLKGGLGAAMKSIKAGQVLDVINKRTINSQLVAFGRKSIVNPNTNATFTGNRLRSFGFNFKLVASSQKESAIIRNIHTAFRRFTYGRDTVSENKLTIAFPPKWDIKFVDFESPTGENQYIPKIHECYLTQVESAFNSDANVFYSDSAPLQVDITLQFQETRILTRGDIEELKEQQLGGSGGDDNPFGKFSNPLGKIKSKVKSSVIEGVKNIF